MRGEQTVDDSEGTSEEGPKEPEPGFRKVDKRHSAGPADSAAPDEAEYKEAVPEESTPPEESETQPEAVPLSTLDVYATLRFMAGLLAQQAWIMLGVQLAPGATDLKQDLVQARIAIDTLEFITRQLQPELDDAEKAELANLLANLHINYVKKA